MSAQRDLHVYACAGTGRGSIDAAAAEKRLAIGSESAAVDYNCNSRDIETVTGHATFFSVRDSLVITSSFFGGQPMHLPRRIRNLTSVIVVLGALCAVNLPVSAQTPAKAKVQAAPACPDNDSGLKLPAGFCATVFADGVGHARHMVIAPNGVLYVNTWSGRYYGNDTPHAGGFLVALQDTSGTGKADVNQRFGETVQSGGAGGTGIGLYRGALFAEINDKIVRYVLPAGSIVPQGPAVTIVSGLPLGGDHPMHPFAIDTDGSLYVDVASATNACQAQNRTPKSRGIDPCTELETRGGIWRYDANKTNQTFSPA
jgi:glucose/arabinose dehydrogenase